MASARSKAAIAASLAELEQHAAEIVVVLGRGAGRNGRAFQEGERFLEIALLKADGAQEMIDFRVIGIALEHGPAMPLRHVVAPETKLLIGLGQRIGFG